MQKIQCNISVIFISLIAMFVIHSSSIYAAGNTVKQSDRHLACIQYTSCNSHQNRSLLAFNVASPTPTTIPTKAATPTLTITAEVIPTETQTPVLTATLTPVPVIIDTSSRSEEIFSKINAHRATLNLPPFQKEDKLCSLAASRGPELQNEVNTGTIHKGLYDRNLPYWITENMAYYPSVDADMNFWLNSSIHRSAIQGDFQYSCGHCEGNACIVLFTNYTPK